MAGSNDIAHTEQRLTEVDALQQTIDQLREELLAYSDALRQELAWLQQEHAVERIEQPVELEPIVEDAPALESISLDDDDDFISTLGLGPTSPAAQYIPQSPAQSPFELEEPDLPADGRIGGKPVSVLISDGSISAEPLSGWVIDRPSGGLKILIDDEIQIGTVINVRPSREHPEAEWISVSVKQVTPERQSFIMSCQFVGRPAWKALALLNGDQKV
jgi:hypothetical protein